MVIHQQSGDEHADQEIYVLHSTREQGCGKRACVCPAHLRAGSLR